MSRKRFFNKLLISYILLLFLPIIIFGYISYFSIANSALKVDEEYSLNSLENAVHSVDLYFNQIDKFLASIVMDDETGEVLKAEYRNSEYNRSKYLNNLIYLTSVNESIEGIYITDKQNIIVSSYYGYKNSKEALLLEGKNSGYIVEWYPRTIEILSGENLNTELDVFTKHIRLKNSNGYVVLDVRAQDIHNAISQYINDVSSFYILSNDTAPQLIATNQKGNSVNNIDVLNKAVNDNVGAEQGHMVVTLHDGNEYSIAYIRSDYSDWIYIEVTPLDILYARANNIRNTAVLAAVICLLIGVILSIVVSVRFYKPIEAIKKIVTSPFKVNDEEYLDELKYIRNSVEKIIRTNRVINKKLEKSRSIVRNKLINDIILTNNFKHNEENDEYFKRTFTGKYYLVYIINFDSSIDIDMLDIIQETKSENGERFPRRELEPLIVNNNAIIVMQFDDEPAERKEIHQYLNKKLEAVYKNINHKCYIGIGTVVDTYKDIHMSYKQSLSALEYRLIAGWRKVVFYDDYHNTEEDFDIRLIHKYIPEAEITQELLEKKAENIGELFRGSISKFLKDRNFNKDYIIIVYRQYILVLIKFIFTNNYSISLELNIIDILAIDTVEEMETAISLISRKIVEQIKTHTNKELFNEIECYIKENLDHEITLNHLADKVYISSGHLSRIFKQYFGINFKEYLIRLRIERATHMLIASNISTHKIAEKVGYVNFGSFRKIFIGREGMSPSEYRKHFSINNLQNEERENY